MAQWLSTYGSCSGPKLDSHHPHWAAHNCLWIPRVSDTPLTCTHTHTHTLLNCVCVSLWDPKLRKSLLSYLSFVLKAYNSFIIIGIFSCWYVFWILKCFQKLRNSLGFHFIVWGSVPLKIMFVVFLHIIIVFGKELLHWSSTPNVKI